MYDWSGGANPVPDRAVEYVRRDGKTHFRVSNALDWSHRDQPSDIVSYRALPSVEEALNGT